MRFAVRLLTAAAVLTAPSLAAHADTFQYGITIFGTTVVFDEPAILQADTTIEASSFISSTNPSIISAEIDPDSDACPGDRPNAPACVEFQLSSGNTETEYYPVPLNTAGTFVFPAISSDKVVITDLGPSTSPVPEPSTFALLGTGLIGAAGALRRRLLPS